MSRSAIAHLCLSHFLCKFDPNSKKRFTRDIAREVASQVYAEDRVAEFLDTDLDILQSQLVGEFNERLRDGRPLRFQIADEGGVGTMIGGYKKTNQAQIRFQDLLHKTTPAEFEKLAAVVLRRLGCDRVFSTPASHDQGIDAFGIVALVPETPYGVTQALTWIAQAKHYQTASVGTGDLRELIGSQDLLLRRVFSTVNERYQELELRPFAPAAAALVTTEEIAAPVRRLAERAGIFVFASSDLYYLLRERVRGRSVEVLRTFIYRESKTITELR